MLNSFPTSQRTQSLSFKKLLIFYVLKLSVFHFKKISVLQHNLRICLYSSGNKYRLFPLTLLTDLSLQFRQNVLSVMNEPKSSHVFLERSKEIFASSCAKSVYSNRTAWESAGSVDVMVKVT
jgi:hypothetical protein